MILGVDCYSGYGLIDWTRVASCGVRFAFIKCSEGNEPARDDHRFALNVASAKAAGIYVGAYHFGYFLPTRTPADGRSPVDEARRAFAACGGLGRGPGELPPVLDMEWPEVGDWGRWGCDAKQISAWGREYCEEATRLWGRKPIVYTYPFWMRTVAASTDVSWAREYPLWIASDGALHKWLPDEGQRPQIPPPWTDWAFWQHGFKGSAIQIPGIPACPVDRDCFNGSLDELRKLANIDPEAPTQPELPADEHPSDRPDEMITPQVFRFETVHPDVPLDRPALDDDDEPPEAA